ncbi:MAG: SPASM domain-containing protein [Acidimicrobiales bacterium]|nr:SPASM domain-containing protein [Acidimicrobiales bacterium]MCB9372826.1 SPASM domain-containing protein [Microthrixaceae bacterium]
MATVPVRLSTRSAEPVGGTGLVTDAERRAAEHRHRRTVERDLLSGDTRWRSTPYEAHVQFSTYCNLACVMCWGDRPPPSRRLEPAVLARVDAQIAPGLSILTPHDGSEPLAVGWESARDLARRWNVRLSLVTNGTFLDARRIEEAVPLTETLFVSLDSHVPEIFEQLRPGADARRIYANAAAAAAACRAEGVDCIANIVLMVENAPFLDRTLEWLHAHGIDSANVIQLIDVNGRSDMHDPLRHLSVEYVEGVRRRAHETARRLGSRLIWLVGPTSTTDARPRPTRATPGADLRARRVAYDRWNERLRLRHPGYCPKVFDRVRVTVDGATGPCSYAANGELEYGTLATHDFETLWNGETARDLRRAMATGDPPVPCDTCRWRDLPARRSGLPFTRSVEAAFPLPATGLVVDAPDHGARLVSPPSFVVRPPDGHPRRWLLALSLGGETTEVHRVEVGAGPPGGETTVTVPPRTWRSLRPNVGYWWALWAIADDGSAIRNAELSALVRHRSIPRRPGSGLRYRDRPQEVPVHLGGGRTPGFVDRSGAAPATGSSSRRGRGRGLLRRLLRRR